MAIRADRRNTSIRGEPLDVVSRPSPAFPCATCETAPSSGPSTTRSATGLSAPCRQRCGGSCTTTLCRRCPPGGRRSVVAGRSAVGPATVWNGRDRNGESAKVTYGRQCRGPSCSGGLRSLGVVSNSYRRTLRHDCLALERRL